jgi:hypothetical protein
MDQKRSKKEGGTFLQTKRVAKKHRGPKEIVSMNVNCVNLEMRNLKGMSLPLPCLTHGKEDKNLSNLPLFFLFSSLFSFYLDRVMMRFHGL